MSGLTAGMFLGVLLLTPAGSASREERKGGASQPSEPVTVRGVVTYTGPLLDPVPISEAGTSRHPIEVDPESMGLKDAVVWLEGVPRQGEGGAIEDEPALMDQQNYEFIPHVLAVRAGRPVVFLNSDSPNHGVTASSLEAKNRFNVATPPGGRYEHTFVASRRPVAIGCPIHAAMSAWIDVFDHPYFAVTDGKGRFRLPAVPPGRYTLHVRHADGGMARRSDVVVAREASPEVRVEFIAVDVKAKSSAKQDR